jgi:hypothetical protein
MRFEIVPYIGALPIKFGMTEEEIVALLGEPKFRSKTFTGGMCFDYFTGNTKFGHFNIGFAKDGRVDHVGFSPGSDVVIDQLNVFAPGSFEALVKRDGHAMEVAGMIILLNFGITMGGFHDDYEEEKGVTVFVRGAHDDVRSRMKPFEL